MLKIPTAHTQERWWQLKMQELKDFIKSKTYIEESDLIEICSHFKSLSLPKSRHLLRKGQISNSYYFIRKGIIRVYFENQDKETTTWFAFEGDFFTDLTSLRSGQPSQYYIRVADGPAPIRRNPSHPVQRMHLRLAGSIAPRSALPLT